MGTVMDLKIFILLDEKKRMGDNCSVFDKIEFYICIISLFYPKLFIQQLKIYILSHEIHSAVNLCLITQS